MRLRLSQPLPPPSHFILQPPPPSKVYQFSGVLAARLARMSMVNRTVVEILEKSEDGKAALMMRKAAELLVKVCERECECESPLWPQPAQPTGQLSYTLALYCMRASVCESRPVPSRHPPHGSLPRLSHTLSSGDHRRPLEPHLHLPFCPARPFVQRRPHPRLLSPQESPRTHRS